MMHSVVQPVVPPLNVIICPNGRHERWPGDGSPQPAGDPCVPYVRDKTLFDANSLCFVYRPTAYVDFQLTHMPCQAYILVKPKNRSGPAGARKIALDITAVEFDQFSNNTSPMTILW